MADVTTYKKSTTTYHWGGQFIQKYEVRVATDAAVVANPQNWVALTDAEMTGTGLKLHP